MLALISRSPFASTLLLALQPADDGIRYFSLKEPEPGHGLAWFILNAFFLVGVGIGAAILLGIAFGGFRLWLLEKFPKNRFNGASDEPFSLSFSSEERAKGDERGS